MPKGAMENDYWTVQNHPSSGVTTVMQWADNGKRGTEIAFTHNAWIGMRIAEALNMAAAGERAAELLLPPEERRLVVSNRKFAVE